MEPKWLRTLIAAAGGLLLIAALTRFAVAISGSQMLSMPDPLAGIRFVYVTLLVGVVELAVAAVCLFGRSLGMQVGSLAWLAADFAAYRAAVWKQHVALQGSVVGSLLDPLHLSYGLLGFITPWLPYGFALMGFAVCGWYVFAPAAKDTRRAIEKERVEKEDAAAGLHKMPCPFCGGKIKFPLAHLGQTISCPHCQKSITLRKPENLRMSCLHCETPIEFPSHALGQRIRCPNCRNEVTLKEHHAPPPIPVRPHPQAETEN